MTRVLCLKTGKEQWYDLAPARAVIAAFEQAKGNWNTWLYQTDHPSLQFGPSGRTVFCGSFGAMLADRAHTESHYRP